ncbi:GAF and ANTAR domain-containing protein [Sanguibacter suaedae]|uniref:GAF and ANTAR domain-containing protein n=1 Tax=Sanguibacter suaedae TaxID=2795737 RepID=A0A934ICK4_9MICO|nr:GAF and ANTAR domain-containing protein [Sanguibacter suaedae]MBI9116180.1 GAF and ANTAR domain-containing protein [Sanguibacter suaedae]
MTSTDSTRTVETTTGGDPLVLPDIIDLGVGKITSVDDALIVDRVAAAARSLAEQPGLEQTLEHAVQQAVALVEGCEAAGVSLMTGRTSVTTAAQSDPLVERGDVKQYELDEGPCLDAIREAELVWSDDLAQDPRWPRWAPWAVKELGVRSMLCVQLYTSATKHGALNLYSTEPHAFPRSAHPVAAMFGTIAVVALQGARTSDELHSALHSRNLIGQAQGIMMERFGVSAAQAFSVLSRVSQDSNVKLVEIARQVTENREVPGLPSKH